MHLTQLGPKILPSMASTTIIFNRTKTVNKHTKQVLLTPPQEKFTVAFMTIHTQHTSLQYFRYSTDRITHLANLRKQLALVN